MLHTNIKSLGEKHKQTSIFLGCRVFNSTSVGGGLDFHPTTVNSQKKWPPNTFFIQYENKPHAPKKKR